MALNEKYIRCNPTRDSYPILSPFLTLQGKSRLFVFQEYNTGFRKNFWGYNLESSIDTRFDIRLLRQSSVHLFPSNHFFEYGQNFYDLYVE